MSVNSLERPGSKICSEADAVNNIAQIDVWNFVFPSHGLKLQLIFFESFDQVRADKTRCSDDCDHLRSTPPDNGKCSAGSFSSSNFGLTFLTTLSPSRSTRLVSFVAKRLKPCGGPSR